MRVYESNKTTVPYFELTKQLTALRKETEWLKIVTSDSLICAIKDLDNSYRFFFKGLCSFPKFKKKNERNVYTMTDVIRVDEVKKRVYLARFTKTGIKASIHRPIIGKIKRASVLKTPTGKYFVSIMAETEQPPLAVNLENTIGIDLGIKHFVVDSMGNKYENPLFKTKKLKRIAYLKRRIDRFGGKLNKIKLAKTHEKIANQRKDMTHKLSARLINKHDIIGVESIGIEDMAKNRKSGIDIYDCGWSLFIKMLSYKALYSGKIVHKIDRFEPSSKTCNECGHVKKRILLSEREWKCPCCGIKHDRDINAAINIKNIALNNLFVERKHENWKELPAVAGAKTSKAELQQFT